jgi:hypothetical protein
LTNTLLEESQNGPHSGDDQRQDSDDVHGEVPWHRLGTKLNEPVPAGEAIEASGLNYRVELKSLAIPDGTAVPQRKSVVRSDSGDVLGVVRNSYITVLNYQAFGILDAIVANGGLRYDTSGALGKGERVWMLAKGSGDQCRERRLLKPNRWSRDR